MTDTESGARDGDSSNRETNTDPMDPPTDTGMVYGEHGRCTAFARSAGRRCRRPAVGTHGKCDKHGGASTGPCDPTGLEGNDHADGNAGGGAPPGNTNAVTYGAWSDWRKHYDRLEGDAREYVDELTESYIETAKADLDEEDLAEKARELATRSHLWDCATLQVFDEGVVVERDVEIEGETYTVRRSNPGFEAGFRHTRRRRELMHELRVYPTPDGRPCTEQ